MTWHHHAVVAVTLLQHYEAAFPVVIVYDNWGVVAVASGAREALKRWAAGLLRLEGGCAALGSIIHWLLCILFWSETCFDIKGKMGEGRKTAHCLKKTHVAFMYFIIWPKSRGEE